MANTINNSKNTKCNHLDSGSQPLQTTTNEIQSSLIDSLNFDDTAKQMAALKALIFDTPETNQTKIEFIKEELSAGRYEIHSDHIAAKLLEFAPVTEEAEVA